MQANNKYSTLPADRPDATFPQREMAINGLGNIARVLYNDGDAQPEILYYLTKKAVTQIIRRAAANGHAGVEMPVEGIICHIGENRRLDTICGETYRRLIADIVSEGIDHTTVEADDTDEILYGHRKADQFVWGALPAGEEDDLDYYDFKEDYAPFCETYADFTLSIVSLAN